MSGHWHYWLQDAEDVVRAGVFVLLRGSESVAGFTCFTFSSIGQELHGCWLGVGAVVWFFFCLFALLYRFLAFHFD